MKNKKVAASVFLIAFAFGLNITGIMPVLGILNEQYKSYGTGMVQLLQTLPYAFIMLAALGIGWLTTKVSKKKIVMVGLCLIGICGMLPGFIKGFYPLLVARVLIGLGFGLVSTLNPAIISDFIEPEKRASYMGLHVVGMGIGSMVGNLVGGVLSSVQTHYFFFVYGIAFISMLGVHFLLTETPPVQEVSVSNMKMNKKVYAVSTASFVHTLFITAYSTNVGIYVLEYITDKSSVTGVLTAVNAAFALLVGATFSKIFGVFKKFTLSFSIFVAALGYMAIMWIPGLAGAYIGSALTGVSLSCFMAQGSYLISTSVENEAVAKASGVFSIIGGIGGLVSPVLLSMITKLFTNSNSTYHQFMVSMIGMLLLGIIVLAITIVKVPSKEANVSAAQ